MRTTSLLAQNSIINEWDFHYIFIFVLILVMNLICVPIRKMKKNEKRKKKKKRVHFSESQKAIKWLGMSLRRLLRCALWSLVDTIYYVNRDRPHPQNVSYTHRMGHWSIKWMWYRLKWFSTRNLVNELEKDSGTLW